MLKLTAQHLETAMAPQPWDLSNEILYRLCREYPDHTSDDSILAKIILIGRVYAAAIERRSKAHKKKNQNNDAFYIEDVAPAIRRSPIDKWLKEARATQPGTPTSLATIVRIHGDTTRLFESISGMKKRSLASKYLHFHVPELFFIYDSRASKALGKFGQLVPRAKCSGSLGDKQYSKFAEKCENLCRYCSESFKLRLTPRQLDNLLLGTGPK